jgi:hypothetical protein
MSFDIKAELRRELAALQKAPEADEQPQQVAQVEVVALPVQQVEVLAMPKPRKFRMTVVRNPSGVIDYVDVETQE